MGILGTFALLILSYLINGLTTMSISAISTNGTVKGGGAYYMISRSLGPEFGGAIGIIFFMGLVLNSSLNVVGLIEPILTNFSLHSGTLFKILPTSYWYQFAYSTGLLALCTCVALVGAELVSKTALALFIVLFLSTISVPISTFFVKPFYPELPPFDSLKYTGLSWATFTANLYPSFTSGAAGSVQPPGVPENFRNLFGIFFPATAGIFAGASMSGDLKNPSKSIPEGTIKGLMITFVLYSLVIISMGSAIPRQLLHVDIGIIQTVSIHPIIIIAGELATSLFSVIMGIVGASTILNAIADDKIIPGIGVFTTFKKSKKDKIKAMRYSVMFTWLSAQVFLFADINQIATFITMAFLMTFIVTNVACFLLKIGSAPNFRPSFKYFSTKTAFVGFAACFVAMFIVDGISATLVICFLCFLILLIHYLTPPSNFGDISQLLIYHQVRKYLLRLKLQMSVKYWRPQILLLVDSPRSSWNLIGFCNHLKKGGLYILGHVVIMKEEETQTNSHGSLFTVNTYKEVQKQKQAYVKLRDILRIKAFIQIALGPSLPWGVRNVYLGSGLGGMRPNITVLGFYDFVKHGLNLPIVPNNGMSLPTDVCREEKKVSINQWVQIVEDLIIMQATVAVAANFNLLDLQELQVKKKHIWSTPKATSATTTKYIDLYPIQMSAVNQMDNGKSILSTNFDTYTLILQLGSILSTVNEWKYTHILRVIAFVETSQEVEEETGRLKDLLSTLRIDAEIKIISLDDGSLDTYNFLVKGYNKTPFTTAEYDKLDNILSSDQWWKNLRNARETLKEIERKKVRRQISKTYLNDSVASSKTNLSFNDKTFSPLNLTSTSPSISNPKSFGMKRRYTLSNIQEKGMSLSFNIKSQGNYLDYEAGISSSDSSDSEKEYNLSSEVSTNNNSGVNISSLEAPEITTTFRDPFKEGKSRAQFSLAPDQGSVRSLVSNLRPNFLAIKMPQSQVNDEDDDPHAVDEDNNPTIKFVEDNDDDEDDTTGIDQEEKKDVISRTGIKRRPKLHNSPSIINNAQIDEHLRTPQFLALDDDNMLHVPSFCNLNDTKHAGLTDARKQVYQNKVKIVETEHIPREKTITKKQLQEELRNLTFNDLPAKGQHIILNELMKRNSPKDSTHVIFSTLPAPSIGTHCDDKDSFEYTNTLSIWLDDLPPILLLNSQTVTVTTAL
jgi:potassium/chloride transporter 9